MHAISVLLLLSVPLLGQEVEDTSFTAPNGERVQRLDIVVPSTVKDVWTAVSSPEGWMSFMAPVVAMELKTGGTFQSNYRVGARLGDPGTITNTVLAYVPMQMFAMRIGLTDAFPNEVREANTLFSVLTMEEAGPGRVKIREMMLGWREGPGWDKTWQFFLQGNRRTLLDLYKRLAEGPVDWKTKAAPKPRQKQ
jgi:hypothetical protein